VLFLKLDDCPKIVEPEQGRLSAMPGEGNHGVFRSRDVLDNVFLQELFGHAEDIKTGIGGKFAGVIAVAALQVAKRPNRFGEDLK
jgi:hypothetical protein